MRVIDWFDKGRALDPDAPMFVSQDGRESTSYATIGAWADAIAAGVAADSRPGSQEHVAVYSPNDVRAFAAMAGTWRGGNVWVPVNARNSASGNAEYMNTCEASWLFYHSSFSDSVRQIAAAVPTLCRLVCLDRPDADAPSLAQFIAQASGKPVPRTVEDGKRPAALFGSGGTTGKSKGCVWSDDTWEAMITAFSYHWHVPEGERPVNLVTGPLTHGAGGFVVSLMWRGARNVILDQFDPGAILAAVERHRVTHMVLVPTLLYSILAHPDVRKFDCSSLRYMFIAGAPTAPEKLREAVSVFGECICSGWGQAESPLILTTLSPKAIAEGTRDPAKAHLLKSCGSVAINSRVAVLGEDGRELPAGETGELAMKGNLRMVAYYRSPDTTAQIRRPGDDGWQRTGDIGYVDAQGFFYIVDRAKDMIISGGFNVFSAEVEGCLNSHPAVRDCAVFGIPDEHWGERVHATVELKPGCTATESELIALCKSSLGSVKAPKAIEFMEALPRTPVGKIAKRELRARFWQGRDRNVA